MRARTAGAWQRKGLWPVVSARVPDLSLQFLGDQGGKKIALRGGGGVTQKPIFPTPPPPSLAAVTGGGGFRAGAPDLPCRGEGGGGQPNIYGSK